MVFILATVLYLLCVAILWFCFVSTRLKDEKVVMALIFMVLTAILASLFIDLPAYLRKENIVEAPVRIEYHRKRLSGNYFLAYYDDANRKYSGGAVSSIFAQQYGNEPLRLTLLPTLGIVLKAEMGAGQVSEATAISLGASSLDGYYEVSNYLATMTIALFLILSVMLGLFFVSRARNGTFSSNSKDSIAKCSCRSCKLYYDIDAAKCPRCGRKNSYFGKR